MEEKETIRLVLRKQWYIKNGETKCGFTPVLQTLGRSIPLKPIMNKDFYAIQELADNGVIQVVEVNTKDTAKNLDNKK